MEKTQGNGVLSIGCDKFFKNLFAMRPCIYAASYLSIIKDLYLMMITYKSVYPKYSIQLNLYILRLSSHLFQQEYYKNSYTIQISVP